MDDQPITTDEKPRRGRRKDNVFTPRMEKFCWLYVRQSFKHQNAATAYTSAGYKAKTPGAAAQGASVLLKNPEIQRRIREINTELLKKARLEAFECWEELRCLAKSNLNDILDMSGPVPRMRPANEIPEHALRAIKSWKVKRVMQGEGDDACEVEIIEFQLWDKPTQIITALKAAGELVDRTELTGAGGKPIQHEHKHNHAVTVHTIPESDFRELPAVEKLRVIQQSLSAPSRN